MQLQATDRRVMFGYWPSFIPDNSDMMAGVSGGAGTSAQHTLVTVITKDPSPKVCVVQIHHLLNEFYFYYSET